MGFTLIELLVSMTLLGLLFVLLFGGLRFGMRAWEHSSVSADASDSVRTAQEFLRREFERICPRRRLLPGAPARPLVAFSGGPHGVSFIGPVPSGASCGRLILDVADDSAGTRHLMLGVGVNDPGTDLLRRARSVDFAYLGPSGWQDDWKGHADLPDLIRVRVTFPEDDPHVWPELFIAPRISAEADCTYDPTTRSCRGS
ncbi:MAG: prepilin-type N-terminal cleavage/methylation domain-containing protein [Alphaproteobacteria bacterium]|nr:prepilin-type N-terminal cleavage/methylation domain-containing protein [Alphaproteobacteria bacterium]